MYMKECSIDEVISRFKDNIWMILSKKELYIEKWNDLLEVISEFTDLQKTLSHI